MDDVARHAGVSAMTVSRVIYHEPKVSAAMRELVKAAIKELGYTPNEAARALAGAHHVQIALLYHEPSAYVAEFLFGGFDELRSRNAHFVVDKCADADAAAACLRRSIDAGIDGVLMPAPFADSGRLMDLLRESETAVAVVTSSAVSDDIPAVGIDDYGAACCMTRFLIDKGHRDIGFIKGPPEQLASGRRLAGFEATMDAAGLSVPAARVAAGDFTYRSGREAAARLLDGDAPPTAIFACNDEMAVAAMSVAHGRGLDVPAELSVVGFDDIPIARSVWPELTTIHQPVAEMSAAAAGLLLETIASERAGGHAPGRHIELDYKLVERDSVARI
ncbi:MAG: LacI family DNA-binding transcriptional regulator [Woeseiaceae bacterium]